MSIGGEVSKSLERRYADFAMIREPFLSRAKRCSALTIPSLIPNSTGTNYRHNGGESFDVPWQSMGSRCVNNLASKLMLTLLPPNVPFFRLVVQRSGMYKDMAEQDPELSSEIERGLSKIERLVVEQSAASSDRVVIHEALKHLIVGGNALLYIPGKDEPARCYHLPDYVVRRAPNGDVLEIIIREAVTFASLPDGVKSVILESVSTEGAEKLPGSARHDAAVGLSRDSTTRIIDIYTGIRRDEAANRWLVRQECHDVLIPGSDGSYPIDACPWIPMRFIRVDGEDYGRSYVEEYYGDISSLDALYQALVEGAAACAKLLFMISPNSIIKADDIAEAPNLGFVTGSREDVTVLQAEKYGDFRVTKEMIAELERRLAHAFILNSAVQRDGERVTAEEIRRMVEDLEAALGGVYSLMAVEFQLPYVQVRLRQLEEAGVLPELPKGLVKPAIVTGVEALGRGNDKTKLLELGESVQRILGPEALAKLINPTEFLRRLISASGVDEDNLLVSQEELQQGTEQAQVLDMVEKLGPEAIRTMGNMARDDPAALQAAASNIEIPTQ